MAKSINILRLPQQFAVIEYMTKHQEDLQHRRPNLGEFAKEATDGVGFLVTENNIKGLLKFYPQLRWKPRTGSQSPTFMLKYGLMIETVVALCRHTGLEVPPELAQIVDGKPQ